MPGGSFIAADELFARGWDIFKNSQDAALRPERRKALYKLTGGINLRRFEQNKPGLRRILSGLCRAKVMG